MKKQLLSRKRLTTLFYILYLMLCVNVGWGQQVIGSFPHMDGGFEGQTATTSITGTSNATTWSLSSASATNSPAKSIISGASARSGNKYAEHTTPGGGIRLQSPTLAGSLSLNTDYVVQYYYNTATNPTTSVLQGSIYTNNRTSKSVSVTTTFVASTWCKATALCKITAANDPTGTGDPFGGIRTNVATGTTSTHLYDDFVVYTGTAVDNTDPVGPTLPVISGTNVSWTASGDVDGGGYVVVRYASLPNADNDPNVNGIYGVGNTITNGTGALVGTVVYVGTGTSFTDGVAGSVSGSDYYKIYTVDKAFNYSKTDEITGTAVAAGSPLITSTPTVPLTGFTYAQLSGPSTVKQTVISGSNLPSNIIVSLPTNYELSTDNFDTPAATGTIDLGLAGGTLSIRLKAGLSNGVYNENIVLTSGATVLNVPLTGSLSGSYLYSGSGSLTDAANWTPTPNVTGANGTFNIQSSVTTDAAWVLGAGSKIILGDLSVPAVTLTVASGFGITGTIDIPAASSGSNSVLLQHSTAPSFGVLDATSEVHYQLSAPISTATTFGKVFFENNYSLGFSVPIIIQTSLNVLSGSALTVNSTSYIYFNTGATATIAGTIKSSRATGMFLFGVASPNTTNPALQFQSAENLGTSLVLTGSTVEYSRNSSATTQSITARTDYNNLTFSGDANLKAFQGATTVSGKLTINTVTSAAIVLTNLTPLTISPSGSLTVTSGTLTTGGYLTLKSSECCTATVGPVGGAITGNVIVERNIPSGFRAYRLLSPATTGGTINANWQEGGLVTSVGGISNPNLTYGTHITGAAGSVNGFDTTTNNAASIFTYDNALPAYTALANTGGTLTAGSPYLVYIRGSRLATNIDASLGNDATTLRTTGALFTGPVTVSGLNATANGFSIVGNPYQAQVDMNKVLVTNATAVNLTPFYYVVDPKLGGRGGYATVDLVTPGNSTAVDANQYLQPGQACFVKTVVASAASLNFTEADKFEGAQTSVFRSKNVATARLLLTLNDASAKALDRLVVAFDASESNAVNQNDASKLTNFDESMATSNTSKLFAIEKRAIPTDTDEIPLNITKYRGTSYSIKAEGTGLTGPTPYLLDQYANKTTEIPKDGSVNYAYTVDVAIPASIAADRFKLIYAKSLKTIDNELAGFVLYPNPSKSNSFSVAVPLSEGKVSLSVSNLLGQQLFSQNDLQSGTTLKVTVSNVKTSGVYLVSLTTEGKTATTKWIVE
jgi:hypothetical protein